MIIYKDCLTGEELLTDAYRIEECYGCMLKVKGKLVTESAGDFDAAIGANPSAEGEEESYESNSTSGINVVLANKLEVVTYAKKDYNIYLKSYMKSVAKWLQENKPDRVDAFKKEVTEFVKTEALGKWDKKKWELYAAKGRYDNNRTEEGMLVLVEWEDDSDPFLYYFKDGLIEEKM